MSDRYYIPDLLGRIEELEEQLQKKEETLVYYMELCEELEEQLEAMREDCE